MKTKYKVAVIVITFFLLFGFVNAKLIAQTSAAVENDADFKMVSFDVKYLQGKAYITWHSVENSAFGAYLVSRSFDNENFEIVHVKKVTISPNNMVLLYSYVDESPNFGEVWYKLQRINNNEILFSEGKKAQDPNVRLVFK